MLINNQTTNTNMDEDLKKNIMKTGTSLVGIVCKNGIVMAGDRRATAGGHIIMSKTTQKVVPVNDYLLVSGTGTASDIERIKKYLRSELKLKQLRSRKRPTVGEAANLAANINYNAIRQPTMIPFIAGLMMGGLNENGKAELYTIEPAGSATKVKDYDANFSSGMPYILGLLERQFKENITIEEGVELAKEALKSAMERDPASGNGMDIFTITKEGIKHEVLQEVTPQYKDKKGNIKG